MPESNPSLAVASQLLSQAVGYFALVGAVYVVVWKLGRGRFATARIPGPRRVDGRQIRTEVVHSLVTLLVGAASAGTLLGLHAAGMTRIADGPASMAAIAAWTVGGVLWNDAWFYGWHRLLHHPRLFRYVHAVHHRSVDVNPFTSYSFHAVEALVLGAWIVPAALLLEIPMAALGLLQGIGLANNVMSHLGYEFLPVWLLRVPGLRWLNTATFHSLHHTRSRGNFGLHTRLWDRVFGTEIADYERVFVERGRTASSERFGGPDDGPRARSS